MLIGRHDGVSIDLSFSTVIINVQNSLEDYQFTLNLELFKSNKAQ